MYAENAVYLIIRHLAMVEEHCFTTNGLAPVNHPDTMRAGLLTIYEGPVARAVEFRAV